MNDNRDPQLKNTPTVLIIDDNPTNLSVVVDSLENAGLKTIIASDGQLGIRRARYAQPAIILLDVLMPDMDGFETCRLLKSDESTKKIPVIFMTALSDTEDKIRGFEAGGVDYVTKPLKTDELLARVDTHLTIQNLRNRLEEDNQRFQALTEAAFEGLAIVLKQDDSTRIIEFNKGLEKLTELKNSELMNRNFVELFSPTSSKSILFYLEEDYHQPFEAELLKKNNDISPVEIQFKPFDWQGQNAMVASIRDISWRVEITNENKQLTKENRTLRSGLTESYRFGNIIGKSPMMQNLYQSITNAAASESGVLISGESGTGKELVAKTIHDLSDRKSGDFVAVNCGAIPAELFEREFFGHRKGTFTGAVADKPGYFDKADKGTLFLDEVAELPESSQVKLLRVLQEKEFIPLGDTVGKKTDVRIIAASNKDLKIRLKEGLIREDFFYRIRVIVLTIPPLRERVEDIPLLVDHFLKEFGGDDIPTLPANCYQLLFQYGWPGNIRELQNELQRFLIEKRFEFVGNVLDDEFEGKPSIKVPLDDIGLKAATELFEQKLIEKTLFDNQGLTSKTAESLNVPLRTLQRKIQKYRLQ